MRTPAPGSRPRRIPAKPGSALLGPASADGACVRRRLPAAGPSRVLHGPRFGLPCRGHGSVSRWPTLTVEQQTIASYWADGPGATGTPPGHWMAIVSQLARNDGLSLAATAEAYARSASPSRTRSS